MKALKRRQNRVSEDETCDAGLSAGVTLRPVQYRADNRRDVKERGRYNIGGRSVQRRLEIEGIDKSKEEATNRGMSRRYRSNMPVPVTARFKAWDSRRSPAGIAGSNPAKGMDVCLV